MTKTSRTRKKIIENKARLPDAASLEKVLSLLKNLETRLTQIELHLGLQNLAQEEFPPSAGANVTEESEDEFETQVGENWFAKVGIVVLALGVIFLLTFPYKDFPPYAPSTIGYILVVGIFVLSRSWKDSFQQVSRYLLGGGLLLLYFTTLRLSHFGPQPAITGTAIELFLLLCVVLLDLTVSIRRQSPYLTGLSLVLAYLTALAGGGPVFTFVVITAFTIPMAAHSDSRHRTVVPDPSSLVGEQPRVWKPITAGDIS
jgi:hypothetical protein